MKFGEQFPNSGIESGGAEYSAGDAARAIQHDGMPKPPMSTAETMASLEDSLARLGAMRKLLEKEREGIASELDY